MAAKKQASSDTQVIRVDGVGYDFDRSKLMLSEMRMVKTWTGLSPTQWERGLKESDPDCLAALVGLAKRRAGEDVDFDALDFDVAKLEITDAPDPTQPTEADSSGTTPPGDE